MNISTNAQKVLFCGTFTAGGPEVVIADGKITISKEGAVPKFIETVHQITFSRPQGAARLTAEHVDLWRAALGCDIHCGRIVMPYGEALVDRKMLRSGQLDHITEFGKARYS